MVGVSAHRGWKEGKGGESSEDGRSDQEATTQRCARSHENDLLVNDPPVNHPLMLRSHEPTPAAVPPGCGSYFPQTTPSIWMDVQQATEANSERMHGAVERLCERYRNPIVGFFKRQPLMRFMQDIGCTEDPQDLANDFVLTHLLRRNMLRNFVRGETKFRSFLIQCLKRYLKDKRRSLLTESRGGGTSSVSLDQPVEEGGPGELGGTSAGMEEALDAEFAWHVYLPTGFKSIAVMETLGGKSGKMANTTLTEPSYSIARFKIKLLGEFVVCEQHWLGEVSVFPSNLSKSRETREFLEKASFDDAISQAGKVEVQTFSKDDDVDLLKLLVPTAKKGRRPDSTETVVKQFSFCLRDRVRSSRDK